MKTWVVIPAYNEAENIYHLVKEVKQLGFSVLVIDDGSSDETLAKAQAAQADFVLRNEENLGKGAALNIGIRHLFKHTDFEALVIMDADLQHSAQEINIFTERLEKGSMLVVGNRLNNPFGMPRLRRWTNRFMSYIISLLCRQKIPDTQCGFKAARREVWEKISLGTQRYEIDSEIILQACRQGFKIESIEISSIYHEKQNSSISPWRDTLRFLSFLGRNIL